MPWWAWLLVSLAIVVLIWAAFVGWLLVRGRREEARAFATFIPDCVVLVSRLAREHRVPRRRKLLLLALVAYLAFPIDLVPDFIPVAGQLDDAIIVALVLRHFIRAGGEPLIHELWPGPEQSLELVLRLAGRNLAESRHAETEGKCPGSGRAGREKAGEGREAGSSPETRRRIARRAELELPGSFASFQPALRAASSTEASMFSKVLLNIVSITGPVSRPMGPPRGTYR